jgi:hypothetical protein
LKKQTGGRNSLYFHIEQFQTTIGTSLIMVADMDCHNGSKFTTDWVVEHSKLINHNVSIISAYL